MQHRSMMTSLPSWDATARLPSSAAHADSNRGLCARSAAPFLWPVAELVAVQADGSKLATLIAVSVLK